MIREGTHQEASPPATCDVCDRHEARGIACSRLGDENFAYCRECLDRQAEPETMFAFTAMMRGREVPGFVRDLTTYKDGAYATWDAWIASEIGHRALGAVRWEPTNAAHEAFSRIDPELHPEEDGPGRPAL